MASRYLLNFIKFVFYASVFASVEKEIISWDDRISEVDRKRNEFRYDAMDHLLHEAHKHESDDDDYPTCYTEVKIMSRRYITKPVVKLLSKARIIYEMRDNARNDFNFAFNEYKKMIGSCGFTVYQWQSMIDNFCKFPNNPCYKPIFEPLLTFWGFDGTFDISRTVGQAFQDLRATLENSNVPSKDCNLDSFLETLATVNYWISKWHTDKFDFESHVTSLLRDTVAQKNRWAALEEELHDELGPCRPIERNA